MKTTITIIIWVVMLSGCANMNTATPEEKATSALSATTAARDTLWLLRALVP